jgi:hypothetical protein
MTWSGSSKTPGPGHRLPRLFRGIDLATTRWAPEIEAFERKGEFVVRADLPGMTRENIKVEVSEGDLVIQGERKEEKEQKEKAITRVTVRTARSIAPFPCPKASKPTRPRRPSRTACSRSRCRPAKCRKNTGASSRSSSHAAAAAALGGGRRCGHGQDRNFFRYGSVDDRSAARSPSK